MFSSPDAPLYTNELMVAAALRALRAEGARSVCLGVGPLPALGQVDGCGSVTEFLSRREPLYLLFQSPCIGLRELNALFRALHLSMA